MIKAQNFDIDTPIDYLKAKKGLGNSDRLYYNMLDTFEEMTLNSVLTNLALFVDAKDYKQIKEEAHKLKGASAYIGAGRIHYACYYM